MSTNVFTSIDSTIVEINDEDVRPYYDISKKFDLHFKTINEEIEDFPSSYAWHHFNTYDAFKTNLKSCNEKIVANFNKIFQLVDIDKHLESNDVENNSEKILDSFDDIFDKVSTSFDRFLNPLSQSASLDFENDNLKKKRAKWSEQAVVRDNVGASKKPQEAFKMSVDNSSSTIFVPKLSTKPNAMKPLAILLDTERESYRHPYEFELKNFCPSSSQLKATDITEMPEVSDIKLKNVKYIENENQIKNLVEDLAKENEIAIDLEHHNFRSYQGITCLMQISTKTQNYLIDTLVLREELTVLNEVFTDPKIVKVFHGSDSDVLWLQRDFSLYIVNMFDTYQAAKLLHYPFLSLSYLLKKFFEVDNDKSLQLADWRVRPLSDKMKYYAVCDTHYLLSMYHKLKNELIKMRNNDNDLLISCWNRSTDVCLKKYEKPVLYEDSYAELITKCKKSFNNRQTYAFQEIFNWRDKIARMEDESSSYVLPNHMLLHIAETLPRESQGILALCNPVPPLVRLYLLDIHQIVTKARELPLIKSILLENDRFRSNYTKSESQFNCPHDLSELPEFRDDLPTLFSFDENSEEIIVHNLDQPVAIQEVEPSIQIFQNSVQPKLASLQITFVSPYERYEKMRTFMKAKEEAEARNLAENIKMKTEDAMEQEDQEELTDDIIPFEPEVPDIQSQVDKTLLPEREDIKPSLSESTLKRIRKMCNKRKRKMQSVEETMEMADNCVDIDIKPTILQFEPNSDTINEGGSKAKKAKKNPKNSNATNSGGFWQTVRQKFESFRQETSNANSEAIAEQPGPVDFSDFNYNQFKGGAAYSKNTNMQLKSLKQKRNNKKKKKGGKK